MIVVIVGYRRTDASSSASIMLTSISPSSFHCPSGRKNPSGNGSGSGFGGPARRRIVAACFSRSSARASNGGFDGLGLAREQRHSAILQDRNGRTLRMVAVLTRGTTAGRLVARFDSQVVLRPPTDRQPQTPFATSPLLRSDAFGRHWTRRASACVWRRPTQSGPLAASMDFSPAPGH
jgi:hypothetical protein